MSKQNTTIMVIEDEDLLLQVITKKLGLAKMSVIPFKSGKEALAYLLQQSGNLPDAIWLDYLLNDMNGIEFMQEINKNDYLKQIPVIVVSNSASVEKVQSMLAAGVKKYMLKADYRLEDIISILNQFIASS